MKIPFLDLSGLYEDIREEINLKINDLLDRTQFVGGKEVDSFEEKFATYCGTKHVCGCGNGTDALFLALKALGIKKGDTVVTIPATFIATTETITAVGADIAFVDVDETRTMSPILLEKFLEKNAEKMNVKCIIPVHLYGHMSDMPKIMEIAEKYNLKVLEDCAQAHGAEINGKKAGSFGNIGSFSFYPGKNLGAFGDGGALVTSDDELFKKIKMLTNHGRWNAKYVHEEEGFNSRLDTIQAAILEIKLKYLDKWNSHRIKTAALYRKLLKNTVETPEEREEKAHVYHIFGILTEKRDELAAYLKENGISTGIHYPLPLHLQPAYKRLGYSKGDFPLSEKLGEQELSLPMWPQITEEEVNEVVRVIKEFI